jgi:hypothetical protein
MEIDRVKDVPLLSSCSNSKLPRANFYMLASYIFAIRTLYEPIDDVREIDSAEEVLKKYHDELEDSFGEFAYDYTIHAHLHLALQVRRHGPLKSHSQFLFEVNLNDYDILL